MILIFLLVVVLVLIVLWDWNWFKGLVECVVQVCIGCVLYIGNLDVDFGCISMICVDVIIFVNVGWVKQLNMVMVDCVEIDVCVWFLLCGSVQLLEVCLIWLDVLLEIVLCKGELGNWDFFGDSVGGISLQFKCLCIDDG